MAQPPPLLSLVVACAAVEPHLADFADSAGVPDGVEVIVVVPEGSSSASAAQAWAADCPAVRIVHSTSAQDGRNTGVAASSGTWVSFPSPRDRLGPGYLTELVGFLESRADGVTVVMAHPVAGDGGASTTGFAFPERFRAGERAFVVDLADRPQYFVAHAGSYAVRRAHLDGLAVDPAGERLAGAALAARVLLRHEPVVALLPKARYQERSPSTSDAPEPSLVSPDRYDAHFSRTHLALLQEARAAGPVPRWLQFLVIHDLATYFLLDRSKTSVTTTLSVAEGARFLEWTARILSQVEVTSLEGFAASAMPHDVRAALLALRGAIGTPQTLYIATTMRHQGLTRLQCYHDATPFEIEYRVDSRVVQPAFQKIRGVTFFGRAVVNQTLAWIPSGKTYEAASAGRPLTVRPSRDNPWRTSARFPRPRPAARAVRPVRKSSLKRAWDRLVRRWAAPGLGGRKYADCWLLVDRAVEAHDNAEHLYRHLAGTRPDINAWFVLNRDSPDWPRLAREGFRLIAPRSIAYTIALYNCRHMLTSQIMGAVLNPPDFPGESRWRVHFLRHGITVNDLSRAYNGWQQDTLDTVLTATPPEYRSLVGDGGNYLNTARETLLTGLPRHDELLRKAAAVSPDRRRYVLFLPTWRRWLLTQTPHAGRWQPTEGFLESAWAVQWSGLVNSETVSRAAAAEGLELVFMPHPNMPPDSLGLLGPQVRVAGYADHDIQDMLARAAMVVTDYSSLGFEAAMIDRPLLYFQFDRAEFFSRQRGRPGYFDFERDGFGPVCTTLADAEDTLAELIRAGLDPAEPYAGRAAATFTMRDGRACERVTQAIIERSGTWPGWTPFTP